MAINFTNHPAGILLKLKARPGSKKNELRGEQNGALKVAVTQIAEKGKANRAILELVARTLKLRRSQLELVSGELSSDKVVLVREISLAELELRIAPFL